MRLINNRGQISKGVLPSRRQDYESYSDKVYAPCFGTVAYVEDGHPDAVFGTPEAPLGNRVVLQVERAGQTLPVALTLTGIPVPDGAQLARRKFGLAIAPLKSDLADSLGLEGGLFIEGVEPGSPANLAQIHSGMIVVTIAGSFPKDLDQVGLLLENVKTGEAVTFYVWDMERYRGRLLIRPYEILLKAY